MGIWAGIRRVLSFPFWDNLLVALLILGVLTTVLSSPTNLVLVAIQLGGFGWFLHCLWHQKWKAVRQFWRLYKIGLAVLIVLTFVLAHVYADSIKG